MSGIFGNTPSPRRGGVLRGVGGFGDAASDMLADMARVSGDMMKACANPKLAKAGYLAIEMGRPGPQTCWLANTVYSDGCAGKAAVAQYCATAKIGQSAPAKLSTSTVAAATLTAQQAANVIATQQVQSDSESYPWGVVAEATRKLQQRINAAGKAAVDKGLQVTYCQIVEDGKLGAGTCGAARAVGVPTPLTCKSYADGCSGTKVGKGGPSTPTKITYAQPVQTFTQDVSPVLEEESLLDKLGGLSTVIMGGAIAVALGIVGFAVAKKKGLIGKKVRTNGRRRRPRRNANTEMVPGWQGERTETMPASSRHKGSVLVGPALQKLKDEMRHEGMSAADSSARSGHGVSAKARDAAWRRAASSIRSESASARLPALREAFESGWNTRARAMGYVANRRRRAA